MTKPFSIKEARDIVQDLFEPNMAIFWTDLVVTCTLAYSSFFTIISAPNFSLLQIAAFIIAIFTFYRATAMIHEVVHLSRRKFGKFRFVWNVVWGIPWMAPSFLYEVHRAHHNKNMYGTDEDPEYLPLGAGPSYQIILYLAQSFFIMPYLVLRLVFWTPISYLHPKLRAWTLRRFSAAVIDNAYVRPEMKGDEWKDLYYQEWGACLYGLTIFTLTLLGIVPLKAIIAGYLISVAAWFTNNIRTLVAHGYTNTGDKMTYEEQMLDSINVPGNIFTELWAPMGLRYHALHHFFPAIPYHSLPEAHRRLMKQLPEDSIYRKTNRSSVLSAIVQLFKGTSTPKAS
tara:strand:- start:5465 stop:6487 length:1023 start_codon:yes stop_codon:yes gene_type:complete